MNDKTKIRLLMLWPVIVIALIVLGYLFPPLRNFLLVVFFFGLVPAGFLMLILLWKPDKKETEEKEGSVEKTKTEKVVVKKSVMQKFSWLPYLMLAVFMLLIGGGLSYWFLPKRPVEPEKWHFSKVYMPERQEGVPIRDKVFSTCTVSDTTVRFDAVCTNKWTEDRLIWIKTEKRGSWQRKKPLKDSHIHGQFSIVEVVAGYEYQGIAYSNTGVEAPFRLVSSLCESCT